MAFLKAGTVFSVTGSSVKGGPNLAVDVGLQQVPKCVLDGKVQLLGISNQTQITITPTGLPGKPKNSESPSWPKASGRPLWPDPVWARVF